MIKIFCTAFKTPNAKNPFVAMALTETGKTAHGSGTTYPAASDVRRHFGFEPLNAERQETLWGDRYRLEGFEAVWVEESSVEFQQALELNRKSSGVGHRG